MISKEELEDLYINQKKSSRELKTILGISNSRVLKLLKEYGLTKSVEISKEELTRLYTVENYSIEQLKAYYNVGGSKIKGLIKEYGLTKTRKEILEKSKQTCIERYGVENPMQSKQIQEKTKQTNLERYNCKYPSQNAEVRKKIEASNLERYGVKIVSQSKEIQEKIRQTNLKRYGYEVTSQAPEVKAKARQTFASGEPQRKRVETLRENGTFNTSKPEERCLIKLYEKFGQDNVIKGYNDPRYKHLEKNYQFPCDFYIKSLDLFIECQFISMHWGNLQPGTIFDPTNPIHVERLKEWEAKRDAGHKWYQDAIRTWTEYDPLKRQIAKDNNLNWIEFWTEKEFNEVIPSL